jgi:cyanate permease
MLLEPAAVLPEGIRPYLILMVIGFLVGTFGHLMRSRWVVAIGVIMIFLATLLFPLAIHVLEDRPEPPPGPQISP